MFNVHWLSHVKYILSNLVRCVTCSLITQFDLIQFYSARYRQKFCAYLDHIFGIDGYGARTKQVLSTPPHGEESQGAVFGLLAYANIVWLLSYRIWRSDSQRRGRCPMNGLQLRHNCNLSTTRLPCESHGSRVVNKLQLCCSRIALVTTA